MTNIELLERIALYLEETLGPKHKMTKDLYTLIRKEGKRWIK